MMGRDRENTSTFFARLAHRFGRKKRDGPLSKSLASSPAPQTSLSACHRVASSNANQSHSIAAVFKLPDELILSILSCISPEPQLTGHHARFRVQYCMEINDDHNRRVRFLQPLSMTCKAMRLRLRPWIWGFIEPARGHFGIISPPHSVANVLRADTSLATSVRYLYPSVPGSELICVLPRFITMRFLWVTYFPSFIKCLESLPNLHTLEIGPPDCCWRTTVAKNALKGINLPQIKTLVLPPAAHPFLKHCPNVEDVDWVIEDQLMTSKEFPQSFVPIRSSKVKRLAVPLIFGGSASRKQSSDP